MNYATAIGRKSSCSQAFTLIEILIVVAIMGLMLTAGVPPFVRAVQKQGMQKALSDIVNACNQARANAIISGNPAKLVFRPQERQFSAGTFSSTLAPNVNILSLGVNFIEMSGENEASVTFYPTGISDEFIITLRDELGEVQQVTLDIVTACPHIKDAR